MQSNCEEERTWLWTSVRTPERLLLSLNDKKLNRLILNLIKVLDMLANYWMKTITRQVCLWPRLYTS